MQDKTNLQVQVEGRGKEGKEIKKEQITMFTTTDLTLP